MKPILEINNLKHSYENDKILFENLNLEIDSGEIISILGPSGCGKTTLLRIIAGLETQTSGVIKINNQIISDANHFLPPEKRKIGLVVQERALFPHLSVLNNVTFGIHDQKNKQEIASDYLELFRVQSLRNKYPHEISGGEQQRVALARAMAPEPNILLLDEPFELHNETKKIFKERQATVLIVSHDTEEANYFADRSVLFINNNIVITKNNSN